MKNFKTDETLFNIDDDTEIDVMILKGAILKNSCVKMLEDNTPKLPGMGGECGRGAGMRMDEPHQQ